MNKLVSIVIPCYNAAKTLSRTINSILLQDYKNLEIILVNDGSVDDTLKIATRFANADPRFKIFSQPNSGVSVARNNGLKKATGDYLLFLDADDNYITPYAISKMVKGIEENDADMFVFNFIHPCFEQYLETGVYDLTDKDQFLIFYQDFFALGMPWNKIAKRSCYTEDFVVGVKFTEDEIFNDYNIHNVKKVAVTTEVYHNYYCAPYNPNAEASAVNSLYSADRFWENKSTIWHMGMKTNKYRYYSHEKWHKDLAEDLKYIRSFDFFFWDFFLMAKNNIKEEYIVQTCKGIFEEELFQQSLKSKEKFGVKLKKYTDEDIETFVNLAYYAFKDIKAYHINMSMYKVFLGLFANYFYEINGELNTIDILAKTFKELIANSSKEAMYVNRLLKIKEFEHKTNNCKILMFDSKMRHKMLLNLEEEN